MIRSEKSKFSVEKNDYTLQKLFGMISKNYGDKNKLLILGNVFVSEDSQDKRTLFGHVGNSEKVLYLIFT